MTSAGSGTMGVVGTSVEELEEWWHRQRGWWHGSFAALVTLVAALELYGGGDRRWVAVGLLVVLAATYTVLGTRALAGLGLGWAVAYLALAWSLTAAVIAVDDGQGWALLMVLFPHCWAMLPRTGAIAATVLGLAATGGVEVWQAAARHDDVTGILISTGASLVLSLMLGLFIGRIVREANNRARIIDELRSTSEQLAAAERAQGIYAERERLSREIHDTLAQGFTSVVTLARATRSALDRGDLATARQRLGVIESTAVDNLSEARLIVAELSPTHLQSRTLPEALGRLVDAVSRESGIPGRLEVEGEPGPLPTATEVVLLRTAQEALSNVRRHSGAGSYAVTLTYVDPGRAHLRVTDDGSGFDTDTRQPGYGLDGAAARAAAVDAELVVDSVPGAGTSVTVSVPR